MTDEQRAAWLAEHLPKKNEKLLRHVYGVAETAAALAERYHQDAGKAYQAGLLHDCAKWMTVDEQIRQAEGYGLDISALLPYGSTLLHAPVGEAIARHVLEVLDDEVLGAIRWHTTGRPGMTELEKIVYLADTIEPNRTPFTNLEPLRKLSKVDLNQAMLAVLHSTVTYVAQSGKRLHPASLDTLSWFEERYGKMDGAIVSFG